MWSTEEGGTESDLKESSRGETGKRKLPQQTDKQAKGTWPQEKRYFVVVVF